MIDRDRVTVILLAAGQSNRFGNSDKLLTPLRGTPLALHAAKAIVDLKPGRRIAVCPDDGGNLTALLAARGFEIVANPDRAAGLSVSLRLGIGAARKGQAQAVLLCLADMPFVTTSHLEALLARFHADDAPVVASSRDGVAMAPALFARSRFAALSKVRGDRGGRALLASAALVPAATGTLIDIDRPEDMVIE